MFATLTLKDWLSIVFSSVAVIFSAGTAYFNFIKQADDIRIVLGNDTPLLRLRYQPPELAITADHTVTLVNSGNRAAAIMGFRLAVSQPDMLAENCDQNTRFLDYETEPFVIKPNEILVRQIKLGGKQTFNKRADGAYSMLLTADGRERWNFVACLCVSVVTPDNFFEEVKIPIFFDSFPTQSFEYISRYTPLYEPTKPSIVIKRSGNIFSQ